MSRGPSALDPLTQPGRVSGRLARRGFWPVALIFATLMAAGLSLGNFWVICAGLVLLWPVAAAAVRRLHDTGRSGHWLWLALFPLTLPVLIWALTQPRTPERTRFPTIDDSRMPRVGFATVCAVVIGILCSFTLTQIPGGSMKPALSPGDVVLVWRWSPGTPSSCWPAICPWSRTKVPERGDISVLRSGDQIRIARVIGLPHERVAMQGGTPVIDGRPLPRQPGGAHTEIFVPQGPLDQLPRCRSGAVGLGARCDKLIWIEDLPGGTSLPVLDAGITGLDQWAERMIPPGKLFLLGDNRDNASDSRIAPAAGGLGLVPTQDIVGQAVLVMWSVDGPFWKIWKIRPDRIMMAL